MGFFRRTWAEIDTAALVHNLKIIKEKAGSSALMAVVKANAYGHSACDIAPVLEKNGVEHFAVSNIDEALQLRHCNITSPILILGYTPVSLVRELFENDIEQCVYSAEYAKALALEAEKAGVKLKVHIKLDTGMSRIGFDCRTDALYGIEQAILAAKFDSFSLVGIFTHFAVSDRAASEDDGFTDAQYKRFLAALERFNKAGLNPKLCHCCNSAATLADPDKHLDICRPGIILYGLDPASKGRVHGLIPVMTLKSVVTMVKDIRPGDTVSYGRTFTASENMKIATVAIGYADGYPRLLSGKGYVLIKGKKAPILGRVCMDQMTVDVSLIGDVNIGDEVILFGKNHPVEELAALCGTINYEIVCDITSRVPRIIKEN